MGFSPDQHAFAPGAPFDRAMDPFVWCEVIGAPGEDAMAHVVIGAGEHRRHTAPPTWVLANDGWWWRRTAGTRSALADRLHCPVHGGCSDEMVRTDKTCAICRTGLLRQGAVDEGSW